LPSTRQGDWWHSQFYLQCFICLYISRYILSRICYRNIQNLKIFLANQIEDLQKPPFKISA
jgi:hypothetical protein